jgi:L-2,4-diaminobutyrate decarboxylase
MPVLPHCLPDALTERWPARFPRQPSADTAQTLTDLLGAVISQSNHLHHPRYVGHQVTAPLPQAAITELAAALLNNAMAVYEMGPAATAMERSLVRWMGGQLGFNDAACDGVLTSGGSLGNLTALLAARQQQASFDVWTDGQAAGPPLAILGTRAAHYSVQRALQIMGCGRDALEPVAMDERLCLRSEDLPRALDSARAKGRQVIAVAANSCCTATGCFDRLPPIAEFCHRHGLWLHVDGAHGAAACLAPRYRHLVSGIEQADSVVWDTHKMLLMPALATAVIFKDGTPSYRIFEQQASYLFSGGKPQDEWYDVGMRTLECTKHMMSLQLYAALSVYGTQMFSDYVGAAFDLGGRFADIIGDQPDFELPVRPESNIVCFRYRPPDCPLDAAALDKLQARIRQQIVDSGAFYLVQTQLPTGLYLRVTLINAATTEGDLVNLLGVVRETACCLSGG